MERRELTMKFEHWVGDKVYTVKKQKKSSLCNLCLGQGAIELGGENETVEEFKCPKCFGNGRLYGKEKIYVPVEIECEIKEVKLTFDNDSAKTQYKVENGKSKFNRDYEQIFKTFEDAKAYCEDKNTPKVITTLDEIYVTERFLNSKPSHEKINAKLNEYNETGELGEIVVSEDFTLLDGYITYKLCQLLDIEEVQVKIKTN